jgi:hypothetical protein
MTKYVEVYRQGLNEYNVFAEGDEGYSLQYHGNREEVHSWLAANDYKRKSGLSLNLTGLYAREGLGHAA